MDWSVGFEDSVPAKDKAMQLVGNDGNRWPQTMDAVTWMKAWLLIIGEHPGIPQDEGTMIGWFANAIMAGFDEANRRNIKS